RALCIRVVGATLSCQVTLVINDEMILIEMIVLCEIWTGVELNPGGIRTKSIAHNQVTNAAEKIRTWNLRARAVGGIARRYVWIVPQKLRYRDAPFWLRGPATLAQKPCCIRILEAIDRITKTDIVFPLQIRKFVIVVARSRTVGQNFVEIRVGVMLKQRVAQCRITVRRCPQQLGHHREGRKRNALVIHRLVITTVGRDEVCEVENVIENRACMFSQWRRPRLNRRMPFDRS